ncbi:bile acid:sodium symporter family protein [Actinomycetospora flava]|uniref:Bile acid:sodium symporter n=1 Tax=Actinomycetospora flava TaxID=3129232 RepID=A0ABU8M554_9PSEU
MTFEAFFAVLPFGLAVVMFGLGLELTLADFGRVATAPKAVLVVLACQIVVVPALGAALLLVLGLAPSLALGVVVLLASPGGPMAAVFSHLAGGDVALNITATALNAALAFVTMPLVIGFAVGRLGVGGAVTVPPDKVVQVALVVLLPAALGMLVRRLRPHLAVRLQRPVRLLSIAVVFLAIVVAVAPQAAAFLRGLVAVGGLVLGLSVLSLTVGYVVPRLVRLGRPQAVASSLEIGIHNVALAITVCATVLGDSRAAVVPAMYGALMFGPAAVLTWFLARRTPDQPSSGSRNSRRLPKGSWA